MNASLVALCALDVAGAALIAGLFFYFATRSRERHLKLWALAWSMTVVGEILTANDLLGRPVSWAHALTPLFGVAAPLLFVAGTAAFTGRKYSQVWTGLALVAALSSGALEYASVDPFRAVIPLVFVLAGAIGAAALQMFRSSPGRGSHRLAAAAMGLWALHITSYPWAAPHADLLPYALALSAMLQMATGLGLLMVHLERGQAALARKTKQERDLIEYAAIGVYRVNPDGHFLLANPTLLEILGYTEFETLRQERRAADLYVDEDLASLHLTHAEAEAESEAIWKRRDGSRIQVRITSRRVVDADAGLEYFEGFVSDVTERRRLQAQLESASRLQAVGRLTGGIAHDFNNLLTVIEGNLSLQQKVASSANVQDALEAGRRASELTKQLLSFARAQEGASPTTDAVPQTKVLARLLQRAFPESVDLRVQTESAALSVALPGPDLDQIVMNLVINARDALAKNARGSVLLELLTDRAAGAALLRVSDSGAGIDAELLPRLFEPFVSTRHGSGGTGLGLSIVKEIVDRAGGSITVYSHAGFGTCFEVRLPLAPGAEKSQPPEAYSRSETGTILVVDDDRAVRRVTMRLLQIEGFDVIEASGVAEAKRALRPDLLAAVVDVVMGDGDGFEVLDEIAQRGLGVPALLMSGYPDRVLRERGRGTHPILAKPFRRDDLVRELDALLRSAPPRRNQGAA